MLRIGSGASEAPRGGAQAAPGAKLRGQTPSSLTSKAIMLHDQRERSGASPRNSAMSLSRAGLESSHRGRIDDDMESRGESYIQTR